MQKKIESLVYYMKLRKLLLYEAFLISLEVIGIFVCTIYVFMSTFGIINETTHLWNVTNQMMNLIVFMLSIIMALINSGKVREKKNAIKIYLEALENFLPKEVVENYKIDAEKFISPIDINKEKIKRGDKIELHDKRDIVRNYIMYFAIIFIASTAAITLFVFNVNFPILFAWETFIVYILVMSEFFIYQSIVNKSEANVFSDKHKSIISFDKIKRVEDMKYLQRILYMRCDRFRSYLLALRIFTIVMNVLSISITIIVSGDNEKIKKWFGFDDSSNIVPLFLSIIAIVLYFIDLLFGDLISKKIKKMESYITLSYNRENYKSLKNNFPNLLRYKGVFDKHALDIARGTYEYNIEKISSRKKQSINHDYLFTVEQRIINNIPRVKLTSLIVFLISSSVLVWYKMNVYNLVYVCILTLSTFFSVYYGMLFYECKKYKSWNQFCREIQGGESK